jgi:hypothetical protein
MPSLELDIDVCPGTVYLNPTLHEAVVDHDPAAADHDDRDDYLPHASTPGWKGVLLQVRSIPIQNRLGTPAV